MTDDEWGNRTTGGNGEYFTGGKRGNGDRQCFGLCFLCILLCHSGRDQVAQVEQVVHVFLLSGLMETLQGGQGGQHGQVVFLAALMEMPLGAFVAKRDFWRQKSGGMVGRRKVEYERRMLDGGFW